MLKIGVDVGGTNSDAALLDLGRSQGNAVLAASKRPTTANVTDGIQDAIQSILQSSHVDASQIRSLSIGTTHFVNALLEYDQARLDRVAVIRLCGPFTRGTAPFLGFPPALKRIISGPHFFCQGGLQIDGSQITPVDDAEILQVCEKIKERGVRAIAVVSCFAPIDFTLKQEEQVASIIRAAYPEADVVCSKDVARIGLLEREAATILNASLLRYAAHTVRGFKHAAAQLKLRCPIFLTGNDGTLLDCDTAARFPIKTFSSGPTNSMRGAAFLAESDPNLPKGQAALVADIGGTTTEVGMLLSTGFPRQSAVFHELCGVRVNFPMPHVTSVALGGGSIIRQKSNQQVSIGPDSVGYKLISEALVFGGKTLTTTDVAVALTQVEGIGQRDLVAHLNQELQDAAKAEITKMLEATLDSMKTSAADIPLYLVGGGTLLVPDKLDGISQIYRFEHSGVANAIGAAIATIAGVVDRIEDVTNLSMQVVQQQVEEEAKKRAIAAGARKETVKLIESETIPIAYTTGICRFYAKAAGEFDLSLDTITATQTQEAPQASLTHQWVDTGNSSKALQEEEEEGAIDLQTYRPKVVNGEWFLSALDIEFISLGSFIMACGGAGSATTTYLELREMLRHGHTIRMVELDSLKDDALVGWGCMYGSPDVMEERFCGNEYIEAMNTLFKYKGIEKPDALSALEIGGSNALMPFLLGSSLHLDIPIIDGDFMGRSYPMAQQTTVNVVDENGRGHMYTPAAIASGDGQILITQRTKDAETLEKCFRAACTELGTLVGYAANPLPASFCQRATVKNTHSLCWRLGRALKLAQQKTQAGTIADVLVDALGGVSSAQVVFAGKIVDVSRKVHKGYSLGEITIAAMRLDDQRSFEGTLRIPFQNENLMCEHTDAQGKIKILATVPDLIAVVDAQNGTHLGVQNYKYGLQVVVVGMTITPIWTTERGLKVGGPAAFGYDAPYKPVGTFAQPKSVIQEFNSPA